MSVQQTPETVSSRNVIVNGMNIHYRESGIPDDSRTVTLLIHGWPTSSYLWRKIMPDLGTIGWTIAPDLPGYGKSHKPLDATFNFDYWDDFITSFLKAVNARKVNLVVHDLGGPIGLVWAVRHQALLKHLVLLNTLVYPDLNWSAKLFVGLTKAPLINRLMTQPFMIRATMALGVNRKLEAEIKDEYAKTYQDPAARHCLLTSVYQLEMKEGKGIAKGLSAIKVPVTCIYGEKDRLLPDVGDTMKRVKRDLPHANITRIPNCGHFLQEDQPEVLSSALLKRLKEA